MPCVHMIYSVDDAACTYRSLVLLLCRMNTETSSFGWIFWPLLQ